MKRGTYSTDRQMVIVRHSSRLISPRTCDNVDPHHEHPPGGSRHVATISPLLPAPLRTPGERVRPGQEASEAAEHPLDHERGPRPAYGLLRGQVRAHAEP